MSALSTFLEAKKIKPEGLYHASQRLEARTDADRALAVARAARKEAKKEGGEAIAKPKSGRGLSRRQLAAALAGQPITRRARSKALRAATALLAKRSEPAPGMKDLFGEEKALVGVSKGPAKKKE